MRQNIEDENAKYEQEHIECDEFYDAIVEAESEKFNELYHVWKAAVVQFHIIKQDDFILKFVDKMNSKEFTNAATRVEIFRKIK